MPRILVADLDGLFEEYRETGLVDSRTQIRQTSLETREFHVRDLDGHGLTFTVTSKVGAQLSMQRGARRRLQMNRP